MVKITVNSSCVGCRACVSACPVGIYSMVGNKSVPDKNKLKDCLLCHACEVSCPVKAITIEE